LTEKKKHILFICSWYPNRNNPTHGIFNEYLANAASLYNQVTVLHVCSDDNATSDFELEESIETDLNTLIVYYRKVRLKFPLLSQLVRRKRMLKAYEKGYDRLTQGGGRPDLIQLSVVMPAGLGVLHITKRHNIPYIINEHWSGYSAEDGNYKGWILKYFTRKIVRRSKLIMPVSEYLKNAMLSHGLQGNYVVVPNVVNVNLFVPLQREPDNLTRLIHISSLNDREKNITGMLRGFQTALNVNADLRLTIVGEGKERLALQQLAEDMGLKGKVTFKGRLMSGELVKEINAHDTLLMFSNYETFSLVIIEGFACGKPVITSNAGAIPGYMTSRLGIMVEKGNERQLAEAILAFAADKNKFDPLLIRQFAVEDYSYEKVGGQLALIYERVISGTLLNK
jgi:L-malate glycosyltransferase